MSDEIYQKIEDKKKDFSTLWNRMDDDKRLMTPWDNPFIMRDKDSREEPDVENITMNDALVFANKVHDTLIKATISPEVEGDKLKDDQTSSVEDFIRDMGLEANAVLAGQDIPTYQVWEILQACDRGRIARRITLQVGEDGKLAPESFLPIDSRYLIYEYGIRGLKWVATQMPRSQADIRDEYGIETPNKSGAVVTDYWDTKVERVYIAKDPQDEKPNAYGEPPFVIQVVPAGLLTMDDDRIPQSGESIFHMDRKLFAEWNQVCTILKSLTVKSFFNGLQLEVADLERAKKPAQPPYGKKFVAPIKEGTKGYFAMPVVDLNAATQLFKGLIDQALQKGAFPISSYGSIAFPISGVALESLREAEDPIYFPRMQGLAEFWQRIYRMVIKQYIQFKMNMELGERGYRKIYNYKDLDLDFSLKFHFEIKSPKQDMVNISTAAALGNLISEDTKRRDYLHLQNPDMENDKILVEKASLMSPAVAKYDTIKALFERGEKIKANLMAAELGMTMESILKGDLAPESSTLGMTEPQQPKQLMPLFGSGRATGGHENAPA